MGRAEGAMSLALVPGQLPHRLDGRMSHGVSRSMDPYVVRLCVDELKR